MVMPRISPEVRAAFFKANPGAKVADPERIMQWHNSQSAGATSNAMNQAAANAAAVNGRVAGASSAGVISADLRREFFQANPGVKEANPQAIQSWVEQRNRSLDSGSNLVSQSRGMAPVSAPQNPMPNTQSAERIQGAISQGMPSGSNSPSSPAGALEEIKQRQLTPNPFRWPAKYDGVSLKKGKMSVAIPASREDAALEMAAKYGVEMTPADIGIPLETPGAAFYLRKRVPSTEYDIRIPGENPAQHPFVQELAKSNNFGKYYRWDNDLKLPAPVQESPSSPAVALEQIKQGQASTPTPVGNLSNEGDQFLKWFNSLPGHLQEKVRKDRGMGGFVGF